MKRTTTLLLIAVALAAAGIATSHRASAAADAAVSSAGGGLFPSGAQLYGVNLSDSRFGGGVAINADGTASGDFQTVLSGTNALGLPQDILIEALIQNGSSSAPGVVTFSGTSRVEVGGQVLEGVPLTVAMTTGGISLTVGGTSLPTQTLTEGGIDIR